MNSWMDKLLFRGLGVATAMGLTALLMAASPAPEEAEVDAPSLSQAEPGGACQTRSATKTKSRRANIAPTDTGGAVQRGLCCTQSSNGTWGCANASNGASSCINGATYFDRDNDPRG